MSCFWYWYCYWYWIFNNRCNNCCYRLFGIARFFGIATLFGVTRFFDIDPVLLLAAIVPIKSYSNAEADKVTIISENKNKSGIYMWKNLINKKKYVGSSDNLRRRFQQYFNNNHLIKNNSMQICRALLKHEYSNFSLEILEYC